MTNDQIDILKQRVLSQLSPIVASPSEFSFQKYIGSARTKAGGKLPRYYLIYFLFADLLQFQNLGRMDKVAWSFPLDYKGETFYVEYRKMGLGIFVSNPSKHEQEAVELVELITKAVAKAKPFYSHIADKAVAASQLNVSNKNQSLFERFAYLKALYEDRQHIYLTSRHAWEAAFKKRMSGDDRQSPALDFAAGRQANYLATACIEAFFSWTEHLFIHLAIVGQGISDGTIVSNLIGAEWKIKYNAAIPNRNKHGEKLYNELLLVRQQLRNYVAHGSFGKDGAAFSFHSRAGAVPVQIIHDNTSNRYTINGSLEIKDAAIFKLIEEFIKYLWNGDLHPAMYYTQECGFPSILTHAKNGKYEAATSSIETMREYAHYLQMEFDNAQDMD